MKILISAFTLWCFLVTSVIGTCPVYAQLASSQAEEFRLPAPGVRVALSSQFNPPILKGIKVHPDNLFRFDFILDQGDSPAKGGRDLKQQATKLIKYFLASLTIPEKDLWVNLSPYEKDRIIPPSFGLTEMGRDLLAEDYMLKQITASLIYPEDKIGKKFWKRIYEEAAKKFGTTDIPVNTFNKVWIIPEKAVVYENAKAGTAYVVESKLKVMLEEDYLSMSKHANVGMPEAGASQIIREIIIPELTREVNEGKNFSPLRQVYNSFILAAWYKKKIRSSILAQVYEDKKKVAGVGYKNSPSLVGADDVEAIYQRYLQAFKKGVYNYIKEEPDPVSGQALPRKYFSGGTRLYDKAEIVHDPKVIGALPLDHLTEIQGFYKDLAMDVKEQQSDLIIKLNQSLAGSGDLYRDAIGDADKVRLGYENLRRMVLGAIDKRMDVALLAVALLEENVIDQNMAEELPVFAKLEQLSRSDMTFGLLGGNMSKANMPIYEALLENFRGLDEGGELANTLVRIQEGSVKMLEILGVLRPEEADVFITKSVQGLERISAPGEDLKRRLGDVVNSYKGLTKINQQRMLKRLVPYRWLQLLSQYYGLNLSYMTFITSNQKNFLNWLSEAKDKVDTIKDRVGGNSNAWRIVIGQGIKKTDEWVVRAEPKVDEIKDRVGGSARAWHIVLSRGIEKTDEWVVQAEVKVNAIKYKVGGSNNAWVIVMGHGIEQADEWVRQAEIKVNAIKYKVRGSNNAWAIVINQGMEQADEWVRQAEIKVDAIKDKVGGSRNAWAIVIGQGIEQVDEWVARAALKVDEIEDKVGGNNNAWQIVIDQGIKKTDEWVRQAEVKVGEIKDKVGGSGKAWVIVKAQGIEQVDEWVARAALKVDEIKDKVRGNNNAWKIVIGQGIEQVDEWVARAAVKVDAIKDKVKGSRNAWAIVINQGMEQVDDWVARAALKVDEIEDKVGGNNNAWQIVIGQGIEQVDEWVARAEVKVDAIKDKVGGSYNAWVIVMGHGMQADEWVRQAEIKVREQGVNWRTLIDNGLAFDAAMTVEGPLLENLLTDPGRLYGFFKKFIDNPGDARNHEALKLFPFIGELLYPQENNLTRDLARIKDEKRGLDISLMDHIFTRGLGQKMMGLQQGDARTFNKTAALSQENFQELVLRYQALKGDVMPFFLASFMYHEISKIRNKEFRDRWSLFEGMDFQLPNKASGNVLRHEYFFSDREPGLFNGMAFLKDRPHAKILSDFFYQILENRGFSGQFVRGEITYQNFKPLTDWIKAHFQELKEAIAPGRPDAQAAYQMTNIIFMFDFVDIASLNDQLLTDNLFVNLKALLTDFQSVITPDTQGQFDNDWQDIFDRHWGALATLNDKKVYLKDRLLRFRHNRIRQGEDPRQLARVIDTLSPSQLEAFLKYFRNWQGWYVEQASSWLTPESQLKLIALTGKMAELQGVSINGPFNVTFHRLMEALFDENNELDMFKIRIIETFLRNFSWDDILLDEKHLKSLLNNVKNPLVSMELNMDGQLAVAVDFRFTKESEYLLGLLHIYQSSNVTSFHMIVKILMEAYGLRKDEFDRVYNEMEYLRAMESSKWDKERLLRHAKGPVVLDVGPAGGATLSLLEKHREGLNIEQIVGLDISKEALRDLEGMKHHEGWEHVRLIHGDAYELDKVLERENIARPNTIIYSSILHEIYSLIPGKEFRLENVREILKMSLRQLPVGGRLLIRDGVIPEDGEKQQDMELVGKEGWDVFKDYIREFKGREIPYELIAQDQDFGKTRIRLKRKDAMEFLYTYTWGPRSFPYEVLEQYGVLTRKQYEAMILEIAKELGMELSVVELPPEEQSYLQQGYVDHLEGKAKLFDLDGHEVRLPDSNMEMVFEKRSEAAEKTISKDPAMSNTGGIDLTSASLNVNNASGGIQFYIDPAQLARLQNAPGFVPVIINVQPVRDLMLFLDNPRD